MWGPAHFQVLFAPPDGPGLDAGWEYFKGRTLTEFVKKDLKDSTAGWKSMFVHQVCFSDGHHSEEAPGNEKALAEIFEEAGRIDIQFHGHDHYNGRTYPLVFPSGKRDDENGITVVTAGGVGGPYKMLYDRLASLPLSHKGAKYGEKKAWAYGPGASGYFAVKIKGPRLDLYQIEPPVHATWSFPIEGEPYTVRDHLLIMKDGDFAPSLLKRLASAVDGEKLQLIEELGALQYRPAAPKLAGLLAATESEKEQEALLLALGRIGEPSVSEAAIPFFASSNPRLRYLAVDFVARRGSAPAMVAAWETLKDEKDPLILQRAKDGVTRLARCPELTDVFVELLSQYKLSEMFCGDEGWPAAQAAL